MMLDPTRTSRPRASRRRAPARTSNHVESVEPRLLFATFTVTNVNDVGAGSFRQAILDANAAPNPADDVDYIEFNIAGTGVHTINLASELPDITDAVTIDATADDLVTPTVELNGAGAGAGADGLTLASTDDIFASFVAGLIINRFGGNGIRITGNSNGVGLNYIGTNAAGTAAGPGNGGHGILIESSGNFVSDNVIAFNAGDGVAIVGATSQGNDVGINYFFQNGGLAIDLGDDGRTPNDAGDADGGPNEQQNFPVITVAPAAGGGVTISGTVNTAPNTRLDIALYSNPAGEDEGRVFLDHFSGDDVVSNAAGVYTFEKTYADASQSDAFTATATELFVLDTGNTFAINTSEMSDPATISVGDAVVSEVYVRGTQWLLAGNVSFMQFLEARSLGDDVLGYRVDNIAATATVPWINVNQVVLRYAEAPTGSGIPQPGATITLDGVRSDYTVTAVDAIDTRTFALTLDRSLGNQPAASGGGNEGDRVRLTVPQGGVGSADYTLTINPLQGDADRNGGRVTALDLAFVKARLNRTAAETPPVGLAAYTAFADADANGRINAIDLSGVKARLNDSLPPAPAGGEDLFSGTSITDAILSA